MHSSVHDFKGLIVWQKAMRLTADGYQLTRTFPKEELFVLTAQMRRAAVSIPSNIAEGHTRQGREYPHYLSIARGSTAELETQLRIVADLGYTTLAAIEPMCGLIAEVRRMAAAIANKIQANGRCHPGPHTLSD